MELFERSHLIEQMGRFFESAGRGSGSLVLVRGEAGSGKTVLVEAVMEAAPARFRRWWGLCDPLPTPRPLGPIHDMAVTDPTVRDLVGGDAHRLAAGIRAELNQPTALVIEDVHWADDGTLDLLRYLGRRIADAHSIVIATMRPEWLGGRGDWLGGDLATATGVHRVEVPLLSRDAVASMAADAPLDADRLHSTTGGNPFFVSEVLANPGWVVPPTVADAVRARTAGMAKSGRRLLELSALAPGGLEFDVAHRLVDDAAGALDECARRGLLVTSGRRVAFRHELARLAIRDSTPPGTRVAGHRTLLAELASHPAVDAGRLVHHAIESGDSEAASEHALRAAEAAAASGAHRIAADHYRTALENMHAPPAVDRARMLSALAYELAAFDDPDEVVSTHEQALAAWRLAGDPVGTGSTLSGLASAIWVAGRGPRAARLADEAVEVLAGTPATSELAMAYARSAALAMLARRADDAIRLGELAIRTSEEAGNDRALVRALDVVGSTRIGCREDLGGIEQIEAAHRLASERGLDIQGMTALMNLGSGLGEIRRYDLAQRYIEDAMAFGAERDLDATTGYAYAWMAKIDMERGRWLETERHARAALELASARPIVEITVRVALGRMAVRRGGSGWSDLDRAWEMAVATGDVQRLWPAAAGRAEAAWFEGRESEVPGLVADTFAAASELDLPWAIGELGFWLWRVGALTEIPDRASAPYRYQMRGNWAEAATEWSRIGCPFEEAMALGDGDEAAQQGAVASLEQLGASRAADRIRGALRRSGAAAVPARTRRSSGEKLTRRQLEVLRLVADGLSNHEIAQRLFISEKTAGHHVSAILARLGARSRTEAVATARRMGIPTESE